MPPRPAATSIDSIVRDAMEGVVQKASAAIARAVAEMAAAQLTAELERRVVKPARAGRKPANRARPRGEIDKWVADRRARRVPTFVIDLTGMKTKKQIVAKYGENASFEKGKPAPKAK